MDTEDLKQQVESAIALFTLVDERNVSFCQELMDALKAIETKHLDHRAEMEQMEDEVERLTQENQQLRAMLKSLLVAVGAGRHRKLDDIRLSLEQRVARLAKAGDAGPDENEAVPDRAVAEQPSEPIVVPDDSISEIVARIERTSAQAGPAEAAEADSPSP